jgi:hypothetical protein
VRDGDFYIVQKCDQRIDQAGFAGAGRRRNDVEVAGAEGHVDYSTLLIVNFWG